MQRSFSVFRSAPDGPFATRYPALAHIPCILDSRPGYHRLANAYLTDRGLGLWAPGERNASRAALPSPKTLLSYAYWLANFLEWAEVRGVDIKTCSYSVHVAGRYQVEMLEGIWSQDGQGRRGTTVNARVQQACDFLSWMMAKGLRGSFEVPYDLKQFTIGSATRAMGQLSRQVRVRSGKVREPNRPLQMPPKSEVRAWLNRVTNKSGGTLALMCETVLLTAMRLEEVVCLRTDTLPENPCDWQISNPVAPENKQLVRVSIKYGTKGTAYGEDHGDKIGPERTILIPLELAKRWHTYRNSERNKAFKRWMEGANGQEARRQRAKNAVHLFLNPRDGARFVGKALYDAWTGVELPIARWSPHQGRHWWACTVLWSELQKHKNFESLSGETAVALLESTALSIIRLNIQPQLGHAHDSTTMIYLRWVVDMVGLPVSLADE
jgi:integrase